MGGPGMIRPPVQPLEPPPRASTVRPPPRITQGDGKCRSRTSTNSSKRPSRRKFVRQGMLEQGLGNLLKKAISGEGTQLMKMEGQGRVYIADAGKKITLLRLAGESIFVNGNDVLAYEDGVQSDIKMMRKVSGMMSGGLFNIKLSGSGVVAITSHYEPLTLAVTPDQPVFTDPNATVAWSGGLSPDIVTDISLGTLFGRGSGESIQLKFSGTGWVVVQPYEEVYFQQTG
ncbi:MAG: AIM24 family protein [Lysobacter sp.]|nr:AIM24 family protein [Lysobacter sp.]